jgi:predicted CXXCH cytochrome family protein
LGQHHDGQADPEETVHFTHRIDIRHVLVATALLALGACTNDKIVFRDRPPFNQPPDSANGFLGYFDVATKTTTCGNCHVENQGKWKATKHANAWADLQASGHAASYCNNCHTVSANGNHAVAPAGYTKVADSAYHDVQCENCHGPGLTHVENPILATVPLASANVDTGLTYTCAACHTGVHEPFVDQWKQSAHGSGPGYAVAAGNPSCAPCHEGKAAMETKFGVTGKFLERDSAGTLLRITCVVCHDPHGSPYTAQLRADITTPTTDNLCVTCHSRSGTPPWSVASGATGTSRGAHGAQGLLVLGVNVGWIPPNFAYDTNQIVSSHGTAANPNLCATCHVARTTVTDKATGAFAFQSVGHLFNAVPCLDSLGIPSANTNCAAAQKDFSACTNSSCHIGGQGVARSAFLTFQGRLDNLLDQIWLDANANGVIDSTDGGLIPKLVARALRPGATAADTAAINFSTNVTTVAKGTLFNAALAATDDRKNFLSGKLLGRTFATHMASGNGVHNPFLLEALLTSSIAAMQQTYGLAPPMRQDLRVHAIPPPTLRMLTPGSVNRAVAGGSSQR